MMLKKGRWYENHLHRRGTLFFLLLVVAGFLYFHNQSGVGSSQDFPNSEEGTVFLNTQYSSNDDPLTLFRSAIVPGVKFTYSHAKQELKAGSPSMKTVVDLTEPTQIGYTFQVGGQQQLYVNGELREQSPFTKATKLTGYVVAGGDVHNQDVQMYGQALIPPDILREYQRSR